LWAWTGVCRAAFLAASWPKPIRRKTKAVCRRNSRPSFSTTTAFPQLLLRLHRRPSAMGRHQRTLGQLRVPDFVLPCSGTETTFETSTPTFKISNWNRTRAAGPFPSTATTIPTPRKPISSATSHPSPIRLSQSCLPDMALKTQRVLDALSNRLKRAAH